MVELLLDKALDILVKKFKRAMAARAIRSMLWTRISRLLSSEQLKQADTRPSDALSELFLADCGALGAAGSTNWAAGQ